MMMTASSAASATARRILAMTRLRARRLVLWMEHVWQSGRGSPDQGPTIGPGEVARLLAAETALAEEAAFLAAGEASVLTAEADAATAELSADPGWRAIRTVFGLGLEEADLLALLVALELDPGLGRVIAYLHDDSRLTQPTPWLAARLAGRGPSPFATTALLTWQLAAPLDGAASTQRLMTPWQADPAVALSVFSGVWHDPAIAAAVASIPPESTATLPCLHEPARARRPARGGARWTAGHRPPDPRRADRRRHRPDPPRGRSPGARRRRSEHRAGAHARATPGRDHRSARLFP